MSTGSQSHWTVAKKLKNLGPERYFQYIAASLIWSVIRFDEKVENEETQMFDSFCTEWRVSYETLLPILSVSPTQLIVELLDFARESVNVDGKRVLLELAIVAALIDDVLLHSELLLIELIVDGLGLERSDLDNAYQKLTGKQFPNRRDPSMPEYYGDRSRTKSRQSRAGTFGTGREQALHVLGLSMHASATEIRMRYRELALKRHPDRVPNADELTRRQMHEEFLLIKQAYESLMAEHA